MDVSGVRGEQLETYWGSMRPFFTEFCNRGQVSPEDLLEDVKAGKRQCWIVHAGNILAVALTQVFDDRKKVCRITHLTGKDFKDWQDAFRVIERWAKAIGCERIEALARPGWEKIGKEYGLRKTHVLIEKDLGDG